MEIVGTIFLIVFYLICATIIVLSIWTIIRCEKLYKILIAKLALCGTYAEQDIYELRPYEWRYEQVDREIDFRRMSLPSFRSVESYFDDLCYFKPYEELTPEQLLLVISSPDYERMAQMREMCERTGFDPKKHHEEQEEIAELNSWLNEA